jgi:hypothetical protein
VRRPMLILILASCVVVVLGTLAPAALAKNPNPRVIPLNAMTAGMSYGDWGAKWWQWAASPPKDVNPMNDPTGTFAANGQSGKVWFLAGTTEAFPTGPDTFIGKAERSVTVPLGKMIFFPIINLECSTAEGNGATEAELVASCDYFIGHMTPLKATVDGRELRSLTSYRAVSPMFVLSWPANDVWGLGLGDVTTNSVADGWWIMLAPLSRGKHVIHWEGSFIFSTANGDPWNYEMTQDITYHLTVR